MQKEGIHFVNRCVFLLALILTVKPAARRSAYLHSRAPERTWISQS